MSLVTRFKSTFVATAALALAAAALPAQAAPFAAGGLSAADGIVAVGHRHHHRGDAAAAAAAVGVGALALGFLAGSAAANQAPPTVVYTPEPVYRPAPRVIYREAPPVYDCHIERTRTWDPYVGGYIVRDRRVCY